MLEVCLHDNWKMKKTEEAAWMDAAVPGSVYNDLLRKKKMDDPYYRDNELKALDLMEYDYEYCTEFSVPDQLLEEDEIHLIFYGIDTIADIYLNDNFLGHVENMHRTWEFSVKEYLRKEQNKLLVVLYSPTRYIRTAFEENPVRGCDDAMRGFASLRKAHCMFGWDWGPRLPDAGIWRKVQLVGRSSEKLSSVYITQQYQGNAVTLKFDIEIQSLIDHEKVLFGAQTAECENAEIKIRVTDPEGNQSEYTDDEFTNGIVILNPKLWWPNGYGAQLLYEIEVLLSRDGEILDRWKKKIGLREMTMHIEKDEYGTQFCHKVNGVKIFAMGADYVPEDNILARVTPERTRRLLLDAKNANYNCIRVWGGGNYPSDDFFDICDELGLIVWEDFMFACAIYELTEEFEENITAELIDNIKRIRHHACLGLWCGNNEMEMFTDSHAWSDEPKHSADYIKMYEYLIPKILKKYDPNTFYWPASPSSGGSFDKPNDETRGDVHYWDVWHGNKPITEFRKFYFRYLSEFGFQSFPSLKTCETFTEPQDRNIFSYVMEKHQRNASANGKIMNYMEQTFLYPSNFDTILYASQLLQAEAIRYGVEHFRRNRGRCMGTIVWQLNDCWPVASWSSIDYCGRWKALHYYEKRFFAPIMISCEEEGILTQNPNLNAEPYEVQKSIQLNIANETREAADVLVTWALRCADSSIKRSGEKKVHVSALTSVWLEKESMQDAELYSNYVSYECYRNGQCISFGTVLFCQPKHFHFQDPHLYVEVEGDELVIRADAYAKSVEIRNEADDMLLEDNYFDMNAGVRRIKILRGNTEGLKIRSVYDIR